VLVKIKHERLASPEEAIMEYVSEHPTIANREARTLTHITGEQKMKGILGRMVDRGLLEQVPGTHHGSTTYRVPIVPLEQDSGR
jgi:ATP-dependent DNA helicase RecG